MSHKLISITIRNFKSIVNETFPLSDFTCLIGVNNAGKSNILKAIFWLLQGGKLAREFFYDRQQPIQILGTISGIDANILGVLPNNQRIALQPFLNNGELTIRRSQSLGQNVNLEVFDIANVGTPNEWRPNPNGISQALESIFPEPIVINAMDDSEEDVSKSKTTTTIGKLLAQIVQPMEQQYGQRIQNVLQKLNNLLGADSPRRASILKHFDKTASEKIQDFFPGVGLRLHIPTPEMKEFLKQGTVKVYEDGVNSGRDFNSLGHGAQRSIQMALIRYLAEKVLLNSQNPTTTLLLIDEPELYLHPQAIEVLRGSLKILSNHGYQVVFTTHSPMMIYSTDIHDTLLIYKDSVHGTIKRRTLRTAIHQFIPDAPSQIQLLFSLSNSSQILFANRVLLTEGATELRILPVLFEKINGSTLGRKKIALIQQGGVTNTRKSISVLNAIDIPTKAVVDLDYAFTQAVNDGFLLANDVDLLALHNQLPALSIRYRFNLNNGLPSKGGQITASDAYKILASKNMAKPHIKSLHQKLLVNNIWLWTGGCIEKHLGLQHKNESAWAAYNQQLNSLPIRQVVKDSAGIRRLIKWMVV